MLNNLHAAREIILLGWRFLAAGDRLGAPAKGPNEVCDGEPLLDYTGKIVLITGAGTGIGRGVAFVFARQGAKIAIGDVSPAAVDIAGQIKKSGGEAIYVPTDVSRAADVEALVQTTVETFGGLHWAFNNAGLLPPTAPLADRPPAPWPPST